MNDRKLNQLFRAARQEAPPPPAPGFEHLVLAAIRQPAPSHEVESSSLLEQLGNLFPRMALAAAVVIAACVVADYGLSVQARADLTDNLTELSEQWLFAAN